MILPREGLSALTHIPSWTQVVYRDDLISNFVAKVGRWRSNPAVAELQVHRSGLHRGMATAMRAYFSEGRTRNSNIGTKVRLEDAGQICWMAEMGGKANVRSGPQGNYCIPPLYDIRSVALSVRFGAGCRPG